MSDLKKILVPVDFMQASLRAAEYAVKIAEKTNAEIYLMYVIKKLDFFSEAFRSESEIAAVKIKAAEKLDETIKNLVSDIRFHKITEHGKIQDQVIKQADLLNVSLIILGDNHSFGQGTKTLGSTASCIIAEAHCPVIINKQETGNVIKNIVVPVDLSSEVSMQITSAISFAKKYKSDIHLVSVLIGGISVENSRIFKKMEEISKTIAENNITCSSKLFERTDDLPYKKVISFSEEIKADTLLIMTHQEKRNDNYIGAFAHNIINESKIPVISLTTKASEDESDIITNIIDPFGIIKK